MVKQKKKAKNAAIGAQLDRPASTRGDGMPSELAAFIGGQCSTRMDIAFIAAEMLLHMGRGQMAAQLGQNYSHLSTTDLTTIRNGTAILSFPTTPNDESIIESLFLGFVKSIANNDPALKKQRWKTTNNSDLTVIAALSFLMGNIAWQNRTPTPGVANPRMTRQNVKDAFAAVSGAHCPVATPLAGGGPWCEWMSL